MERLDFFSPTSRSGFSSAGLTFLFRYGVNLSGALATVSQILFKLPFFFEKFIVSLLTNCWHILTFLLAVIARGLILPFRYVIIKLNKAYFFAGVSFIFIWTSFFCSFISLISIFSFPFYRQIFNLLPLLLCFYYSTLAWLMSRLFLDFFDIFSKSFPQVKQG